MRTQNNFPSLPNFPDFLNPMNPMNQSIPPLNPHQMSMHMYSLTNPPQNSALGKRKNDQFLPDDLQKKLKTPKDTMETPFDMLSPNAFQNNMRKLTLDFNPNSFEIRNQSVMNDEMERLQHIQNLRRLLKATEEHHLKQQKATMNLIAQNAANLENIPRQFQNFKIKLPVYGSFHKKDDVTVKREENVKQEEPLLPFKPMMNFMPFNWTSMESYHSSHDTASETSEEKLATNNKASVVPEPVLLEYTRAFPDWDIATIFNFLRSGRSEDSFEKERVFRAERKKRRAQKRLKTKSTKSSKSKEADKN